MNVMVLVKNGKMEFYGMASETAMDRHNVPHREYRGVEGKTVSVPYSFRLSRIL